MVLRLRYKKIVPVPFMTYLVLIQLILTAYLLENWVLDPPEDSKSGTTGRLKWKFWVLYEISVVAAGVPSTAMFLFLRAFGFDLSDP